MVKKEKKKMSTFLDMPHQVIPYFEPVKRNNAKKNFKKRNIEQPVAGRSSHMLQVIFGLKKNKIKSCLQAEGIVFLSLFFL